MSAVVHAVVAGPILKKSTPAATTSLRASAPEGVVPPRGGPFASTIGNTFDPFRSTVPLGSIVVTAASALAAASAKTATTTARPIPFNGTDPSDTTRITRYEANTGS